MDKMLAVRCFIEVAERGSFTAAALTLDLPPSSVSRRVQDLEVALGARLLHRTTRVVRLTELGALYLARARDAVTTLDQADALVGDQATRPTGRLRITATPGFGRVRLLPVLRRLRERYPDIVLDVDLTDAVTNPDGGEIDLAVRSGAVLPDRSVARKLAENRFLLVAAPDYLQRWGTPRSLGELAAHRALLYRAPSGVLAWQALRDNAWQVAETRPAFISNEGAVLVEESVAGSGIALLPDWGITEELADGRLVEVVLEDARVAISRNPNSGIYLLYDRPRYALAKIRVAVDFLLAELTEGPSDRASEGTGTPIKLGASH